jgi:hypothetical protein
MYKPQLSTWRSSRRFFVLCTGVLALFVAFKLARPVPAAAGGETGVKIVSLLASDPALLEVQILRANGAEEPAKVGSVLGENDRIRTGYRSGCTLDFSGKAVVLVEELTEFKVGIFRLGTTSEVELWLREGGLEAQVTKPTDTRTHFVVRTPTVTASVRGTLIHFIRFAWQTGCWVQMGRVGQLLVLDSFKKKFVLNANNAGRDDMETGHYLGPRKIQSDDARTKPIPKVTENENLAASQQVINAYPVTSFHGGAGGMTDMLPPPPPPPPPTMDVPKPPNNNEEVGGG